MLLSVYRAGQVKPHRDWKHHESGFQEVEGVWVDSFGDARLATVVVVGLGRNV